MNDGEVDAMLRSALTGHLKPLVEWAGQTAVSEADRVAVRARAFAVARESIANDPPAVLNRLEETLRVVGRPAATAVRVETGQAYFSPGTACIQELQRQFNTARESADVCVFTITDDRITDAIIRAHARGLRVRVITDDQKSHDLGSDIEQLQAAGIECRIDVGNPAHMHHKFALFDGLRLLTGSFNWTRSATEQNEENLIATPDPVLVEAFAGRFEKLWNRTRDVG